MISTATTNKSSDLFQQAMGSFKTAVRAGATLQEESVQRCVEILRDVGSPLEWERTAPVKVTKAIAAVQKNVDQSIRFANDSAQEAVNLLEKALEIRCPSFDGNDEDGDFWSAALDAIRTNAQIMRQANAHVVDLWSELAKEVAQRMEVMREEVSRATETVMRQP
jgi:hypothetical protein